MSHTKISNNYSHIFYANQTYTVAQFFKNYPDCNIKGVKDLTSEIVGEGQDKYKHNLKGAAITSMGTIEVFNYSDLN